MRERRGEVRVRTCLSSATAATTGWLYAHLKER